MCLLCAGAPRTLFGFDGQQLVGQPLSSAIDIFTDWKQGHGEELSLLELLVRRLMTATSETAASKAKGSSGCDCWRVGVHQPMADKHHSEPVRLLLGLLLPSSMSLVYATATCLLPVTVVGLALKLRSLEKFKQAGAALLAVHSLDLLYGLWRQVPFDTIFALQGGTTSTNGSSLLHALQPNRVQPACMKLEPITQEPGELLVDAEAADTTPVLQVC
jgi:hypothetical protein